MAVGIQVLIAVMVCCAGSTSACPKDGETWCIGLDLLGKPADPGPFSPHISADGRYVAYPCLGSTLVPNDNNRATDVFVYDMLTGSVERVSVSSTGEEGNGESPLGRVSADGSCVVFTSEATNLVPGDTNGCRDVFVRDRVRGTTERVNVSSKGEQADGNTMHIDISANGRYVVFDSWATNLVDGDTNGHGDIFIHDRKRARTKRVSVSSAGEQANDVSYTVCISGDDRYVAYVSRATNLVPGDAGGPDKVFIYDTLLDTTEFACVTPTGEPPNGGSARMCMSGDGRYIAFDTAATNLDERDTNGKQDVYVRDRYTGAVERVSVSTDGDQANAACYMSSLSANGRCVAFGTSATTLVPGVGGKDQQVFVHDRWTGKTICASVSSLGDVGDRPSTWGTLSGDGRTVVFNSYASNLISGQRTRATSSYAHRCSWCD